MVPQELNKITLEDLGQNKIQIWSCFLDQTEQIVSGCYSILSNEEKSRAGKLKFTELRNRWVLSRGVLRLLLSNYYNCSPKEMKFIFNEFSKPLLSKVLNGNEISFNLAHSDNLAVYIFSQNRRIGIDLEKTQDLADMEALTELFLNEYEKKWYNKISLANRKEIFYRIWTCKEAYIKAIGKGFSFSPNKIVLEFNSKQELFFKEITGDNDFETWKIVEFETNPNFVSSAVIEGNDFTMEQFHLNLLIGEAQNILMSIGDINSPKQ